MIQVGDGDGIDRFQVDEVLANIAREIKRTSTNERIEKLLRCALDLGAARRDVEDNIVVTFPDKQIITFPAAIIGEPPGPWIDLKTLRPEFDGNYWILFRGKSPFVASYDNKGWELTPSPSKNRINSQQIDGWKPLWGSAK